MADTLIGLDIEEGILTIARDWVYSCYVQVGIWKPLCMISTGRNTVVFFSVCNPCHIEFLQNVCEINLVEVPKIHKICQFCGPRKKVPCGTLHRDYMLLDLRKRFYIHNYKYLEKLI